MKSSMGQAYSVLEIISEMEKASGRSIPYKIVDRRPGDIATCYADSSKALEELGWKADLTHDKRMKKKVSINF